MNIQPGLDSILMFCRHLKRYMQQHRTVSLRQHGFLVLNGFANFVFFLKIGYHFKKLDVCRHFSRLQVKRIVIITVYGMVEGYYDPVYVNHYNKILMDGMMVYIATSETEVLDILFYEKPSPLFSQVSVWGHVVQISMFRVG